MTKPEKKHSRYKHGMGGATVRNPLYLKWTAMKRRCYNKNEKCYLRYGGRGIKVCDKWLDFMGFYEDMGASFKKGLSLERINNDKGYSKQNCKWITLTEQARNKRSVTLYSYKGKKYSIPELAKISGIAQDTMFVRLKKLKWSVEEAVSVKSSRGNKHRKKNFIHELIQK